MNARCLSCVLPRLSALACSISHPPVPPPLLPPHPKKLNEHYRKSSIRKQFGRHGWFFGACRAVRACCACALFPSSVITSPRLTGTPHPAGSVTDVWLLPSGKAFAHVR